MLDEEDEILFGSEESTVIEICASRLDIPALVKVKYEILSHFNDIELLPKYQSKIYKSVLRYINENVKTTHTLEEIEFGKDNPEITKVSLAKLDPTQKQQLTVLYEDANEIVDKVRLSEATKFKYMTEAAVVGIWILGLLQQYKIEKLSPENAPYIRLLWRLFNEIKSQLSVGAFKLNSQYLLIQDPHSGEKILYKLDSSSKGGSTKRTNKLSNTFDKGNWDSLIARMVKQKASPHSIGTHIFWEEFTEDERMTFNKYSKDMRIIQNGQKHMDYGKEYSCAKTVGRWVSRRIRVLNLIQTT